MTQRPVGHSRPPRQKCTCPALHDIEPPVHKCRYDRGYLLHKNLPILPNKFLPLKLCLCQYSFVRLALPNMVLTYASKFHLLQQAYFLFGWELCSTTPVCSMSSLICFSKSSILLPISSTLVMIEFDMVSNLPCICCSKVWTYSR